MSHHDEAYPDSQNFRVNHRYSEKNTINLERDLQKDLYGWMQSLKAFGKAFPSERFSDLSQTWAEFRNSELQTSLLTEPQPVVLCKMEATAGFNASKRSTILFNDVLTVTSC